MTMVAGAVPGLTLVIGASGKTGRRVVQKLQAQSLPVRGVSRSTEPAFDWDDPSGWDTALDGVARMYVTYSPDLAMPQAKPAIRLLMAIAREKGVKHVVLLSGRGEPDAQACEQVVKESGLVWTVVRASWFNQNFSEGEFAGMIGQGFLALPAGDTLEPFVDAEDIADVAVAALTGSGHAGQIYEVTGPRLLTLKEVVRELAAARGQPVRFDDLSHDAFIGALREQGAPDGMVMLLDYLFGTVLDGRNSSLGDGVQRALGRPPRDFRDFARDSAARGAWPDMPEGAVA